MVSTRKFSQFLPANLQEAVGLAGGANSIGPGGGGSAAITYTFTQATPVIPALYLGAAVRVDVPTGLWETTLATTPAGSEFLGFIVNIVGTTYTVQFAGLPPAGIPLGGLNVFIAGTPYYLSDSVAGGITAVPPTVNGEVNLPVLWAMDNGNPVIRMSRGFVVGASGSGGGGGGGSPNNVATVIQAGNGFHLGDALYISADQTFSLANAYSNLNAAQAEWVVTSVTPPNTFTIQQGGMIQGLILTDDNGAGIMSGEVYYISPKVGQEGKLTAVEPTGAGQFTKPFYIQQIASSHTGWLLDQRPLPATVVGPPFINATGGIITTNGNRRIHTFLNSGNFQILSGSGPVDYLIVAGGGGGGSNNSTITSPAAGGGAGGLLAGTTGNLTVGNFPVVVGAAGLGGAAGGYNQGANGGNSSFNGNTSTGGGGGGSAGAIAPNGLAGGSGGGGATNGGTAGAGTPGQGNAGGTQGVHNGAGGGGGAGGIGGVGSNAGGGTNGGAGGPGAVNAISGAPQNYAGGGGGGAFVSGAGGLGGVGGGGNGGNNAVGPTAGTANTGGGGGGCGDIVGAGANGGSGIVILSYQYM